MVEELNPTLVVLNKSKKRNMGYFAEVGTLPSLKTH
jgi:hypothetical protein